MIRFILKRKRKLACGVETEDYEHIDKECYILEESLSRGGFSEDEYDYTKLEGVEILPDVHIEVNAVKKRKQNFV